MDTSICFLGEKELSFFWLSICLSLSRMILVRRMHAVPLETDTTVQLFQCRREISSDSFPHVNEEHHIRRARTTPSCFVTLVSNRAAVAYTRLHVHTYLYISSSRNIQERIAMVHFDEAAGRRSTCTRVHLYMYMCVYMYTHAYTPTRLSLSL